MRVVIYFQSNQNNVDHQLRDLCVMLFSNESANQILPEGALEIQTTIHCDQKCLLYAIKATHVFN